MPGSADSSVGDMQAAARAERSGAEQPDCWSQWPSKTTAGGIRALPEGGERSMAVSLRLPVCICSCSEFKPKGEVRGVEVEVVVALFLPFSKRLAFHLVSVHSPFHEQ